MVLGFNTEYVFFFGSVEYLEKLTEYVTFCGLPSISRKRAYRVYNRYSSYRVSKYEKPYRVWYFHVVIEYLHFLNLSSIYTKNVYRVCNFFWFLSSFSHMTYRVCQFACAYRVCQFVCAYRVCQFVELTEYLLKLNLTEYLNPFLSCMDF